MIKFLLQRPIAVLMAFTACFIVGLVTYFTIPVSLLPDIAIPEITVQVSGQNTSARELENTVVKTIRQQLMQVASLRDIHSETRDGAAIIRLNFDFGTNTDLAFIEVNEKIDAAMNYLPREVERPRVIKASATDIPVFCLNLTLKSDSAYSEINEGSFLDLCQFAETVIKRRIEQLPEVAMVDVTGILKRQLQIVPDMKLLKMSEITLDDLEAALTSNNIEPGSMTVRDGYYEYNIKFSTLLRTPEDVENIYIRKNNHIFQLKDLARISVVPEKETGASLSNGKRAVTLAVIKQADENMDNMKEALAEVTDYFASVYPDIDFSVSRNQTELLDYTISNLKQNLSLGFLFICIVAILFLGDIKSPAVIGLSMVVSLIISFLFFYLCKMSLNIISISGLILALGMMIDSSIIVTENITQYRTRGDSLEEACNKGTTEVITPMLSSTFTTIAVFVPLVFMSGIAGAIFFDQAFAVTVGLMVSYFTGIMLLPVLYKLVYSIPDIKHKDFNMRINNLVKEHTLDRFYDTGVDFVFRHKTASLIFIAITLPLCAFLFYEIPKSKRSVYLLPMYPFLSLAIANLIVWLLQEHRRIFKAYAVTIVVIGVVFSVALIALHAVDLSFLGDSRSSRRLALQLGELQKMPMGVAYVLASLMPVIVAVAIWMRRKALNLYLWLAVGVWVACYMSLDGVLNPALKNCVPDYYFAQKVKVYQPDGRIGFYRVGKEEPAYAAVFYLDDKVMPYSEVSAMPETGYVMLREANKERFEEEMSAYRCREVARTDNEFTSFKGNLLLYKYDKR